MSAILFLKKDSDERNPSHKADDVIHSARLGNFSNIAAKYTTSIDIDPRILQAVIRVNKAHVLMLTKQKIISRAAAKSLISALNSIPNDLELKEILEDVHMNVEDWVISRIGKEVGGTLNLAKSRNDQVATALRMTDRNELLAIIQNLIILEEALIEKAQDNGGLLMPGYTHMQRAQPVTVGHHLLSYEEAISRDLERAFDCYSRVNVSPMGAGALASTGFALDREYVASLLGFDSVLRNSLDSVSSRDFAIETIYVCSQIMNDLSRLAEEIILWTTKEFSFAEISDSFAATSSMMPQKKNAIVPEIARARSAQVAADLIGALGISKSLPQSYNLDLQELTRNLWSAVDKTRDTIFLFAQVVRDIKFHKVELITAVSEDETLFATELADYLVSKHGLAFRDAHARVGALVKQAESSGNLEHAFSQATEKELSSFLGVKVTKEEMANLLNPELVLARRTATGSPNPKLVVESCRQSRANLKKKKQDATKLQVAIERANKLLDLESYQLIHGSSQGK